MKSVTGTHPTIPKCVQDRKAGKRELMRMKSLFIILQTCFHTWCYCCNGLKFARYWTCILGGVEEKYVHNPCEKALLESGYLGDQEKDVQIVFTRIVHKLL